MPGAGRGGRWGRGPLALPLASLAGVVVCLLVGVLLLWACDDDSADDPSDDDGSDPTSTTLSQEDQVEAAYLAFADMGARLLENPDPDDPEIAQRTSGEAQADLIAGLRTLVANGQRYELGPEYSHDVLAVTVDGVTATAEVCVIDDVSLIDVTSGDPLGQGTTTAQWTVTLTRPDDSWVVEQVSEREIGEGALPCA